VMGLSIKSGCALLAAGAVVVSVAQAPAATGAIPARWRSCKVVNERFPHGVGRRFAHDRTKSGDPVTNFRRSTLIYRRAMRYNPDLDRDRDGIACEKH
jgi:hypothetical protein